MWVDWVSCVLCLGRGGEEVRTGAVWGVFPHLADQLGHGIPVLIAAGVVELLDVMGGLNCVGLRGGGHVSGRRSVVGGLWSVGGDGRGKINQLPCCRRLVGKPTGTTVAWSCKTCRQRRWLREVVQHGEVGVEMCDGVERSGRCGTLLAACTYSLRRWASTH